jgi:hypothetical protein
MTLSEWLRPQFCPGRKGIAAERLCKSRLAGGDIQRMHNASRDE